MQRFSRAVLSTRKSAADDATLLGDRKKSDAPSADDLAADIDQVELELVQVLRENGVSEICKTIKSEINTIWAVQTGFKTLASVGHFYFSCGEQVFTVTPSDGFYDSDGIVLALFALRQFPHHPALLCPVLDAISIYAKLDVERALAFCAVDDGTQLIMNCVRNHSDKPEVICMALDALGSLILNDDLRTHIATAALVEELQALLHRYKSSLNLARAFLYPLSNLVVLRELGQHFVEHNGIPTVLHALQMHKDDAQTTWYALALLNALATDSYHTSIMATVHESRGVRMIARAIAKHVDVEEITLEGFQLLECIAIVPDCFRVINQNHVLDLAYRAVALYKGPQYAHTRLELAQRITTFQKCAIQDGHVYAMHEGVTHGDSVLYTVFLLFVALYAALSPYGHETNTAPLVQLLRLPPLMTSVPQLYTYLSGAPFQSTLFPTTWYNGEPLDNPRLVVGSLYLLGAVQVRQVRATSNGSTAEFVMTSQAPFGNWSSAAASQSAAMAVHGYDIPAGGYLTTLPLDPQLAPGCATAVCALQQWVQVGWLDASTRAVVVEWNLYNVAMDAAVAFQLVFVFDAANGAIYSSVTAQSVLFNPYQGLFLVSGLFYLELALVGFTLHALYTVVAKVRRYRQYYFYIPSHVFDLVLVVLWLAMWGSRLRFLALTTYSLSVQLAGSSFVSLQEVAAVAKQERVLFGCISLLMWLNWVRYLALKKLRYLLCVLDASMAAIASYGVYASIVVLGLAHFRYTSTSSPSLWASIAEVLKNLVYQDSSAVLSARDPHPLWTDVLYLVIVNCFTVPWALMALAPHLRAGYATSAREPEKAVEPPKRSLAKSKRSFKRTMTAFTKDLKVMLEQRQLTIRKHAFAPWEQSDASWNERAAPLEQHVRPLTAPEMLTKLRRLVDAVIADTAVMDASTGGLVSRLEHAHHVLRSHFGLPDKPRIHTNPVMLSQLKSPPESYVYRRRSSGKDTREASA
ncbi:Polycystin Cation Channel (PCC) Family [Achlya hypogyna]|uniref:Polycystin Cation Channel (PCC) Family n=1 Tax=Achlya hypogyna TaxID=1202772 RepID=A0A1V9YIV9_ACHHY|nr:Polycystin Cation Channel (PCC) Family [Achlya hypogyna]